jgi:PAS domain S-box-containing protein
LDITERKRVEEALKQSEKRYRSYLEVTEQLGWTTDGNGEVVEDIPSWRRFTGQTEEDVKGWGWSKALHLDDLEQTVRVWRKAVAAKNGYETEYRIRRYDGVYRHFLARGVPVYKDDGEIREWVGTCIDITERKMAEEAVRQSRDELERRVQERTAELKKTNEELQQRNRDLEEFAHVASHDLQEPLRKIQTFADLLTRRRQQSTGDKPLDYLERMRRAAGRMQALVLDLLRYSRVTSKLEPFTRFNLREPIQEAVTDLGVLREETGGRIEVGDLPEIEADRVQMRQLFQNLIANGLKYRGEEKPLIKVFSRSSDTDPFWEIHVGDNGIGFDECYLEKIFKPFQRLHGKDAPYEGTGMGLAICRRIVESHGGSITARSEPGKGATFIVKLPRKQ